MKCMNIYILSQSKYCLRCHIVVFNQSQVYTVGCEATHVLYNGDVAEKAFAPQKLIIQVLFVHQISTT